MSPMVSDPSRELSDDDPSSEVPSIPPGLPADARYVRRTDTWQVGPVDDEGRAHGRHTVFRSDGSLASKLTYEHGELDGDFQRFHPNGEVAKAGRFTRGQLEGEVVAFASTDRRHEQLRSCCVPSGATTMVARYEHGRCLSEVFYDAQSRRLLEDGSLHPDWPDSVPADATFIRRTQRWELGRGDQAGRQGLWRWWWKDGTLAEIATFEDGRLHGTRERYDPQGALVTRLKFRHGVRHGDSYERVAAGTYVDTTIVARQGEFEEGLASGRWSFQDSAGQEITSVNWGHPQQAIAPETADTEDLRVPSTSVRLSERETERMLREVRQEKLEMPRLLARICNLVNWGVAPARVARELAGLLLVRPRVGLEFARHAVALAPDDSDALGTFALLCIEVGQVDEARRAVARLTEHSHASSDYLCQALRVTYPSFSFVPRVVSLDERAVVELPQTVAQDLGALRRAISKSAQRVDIIRQALLGSGLHAELLPPDTGALCTSQPERLECYEFVVEFADGSDTIVVKEDLEVEALSTADLMRLARAEWQMLCWLCFCAGLDEIAMPERLSPQPRFAQALATAFRRHYRAADQCQTSGLRSRVQKLASFQWEGMDVGALPATFARMALREHIEMRAALFFAGDPECRSPWQDDLRG